MSMPTTGTILPILHPDECPSPSTSNRFSPREFIRRCASVMTLKQPDSTRSKANGNFFPAMFSPTSANLAAAHEYGQWHPHQQQQQKQVLKSSRSTENLRSRASTSTPPATATEIALFQRAAPGKQRKKLIRPSTSPSMGSNSRPRFQPAVRPHPLTRNVNGQGNGEGRSESDFGLKGPSHAKRDSPNSVKPVTSPGPAQLPPHKEDEDEREYKPENTVTQTQTHLKHGPSRLPLLQLNCAVPLAPNSEMRLKGNNNKLSPRPMTALDRISRDVSPLDFPLPPTSPETSPLALFERKPSLRQERKPRLVNINATAAVLNILDLADGARTPRAQPSFYSTESSQSSNSSNSTANNSPTFVSSDSKYRPTTPRKEKRKTVHKDFIDFESESECDFDDTEVQARNSEQAHKMWELAQTKAPNSAASLKSSIWPSSPQGMAI